MPEGMPYHLETGPTLQIIEEYLNGPGLAGNRKKNLAAVHADLQGNATVVNVLAKHIQALAKPTIQGPNGQMVSAVDALAANWLGHLPGPLYDNTDDPAHGKWRFYSGDPDEILRRTFMHAIEISLGWSHGGGKANPRQRPWRFLFMWKCAQAWLEGWVQWREDPGIVVVIICTPGDGNHIALDGDLNYQASAPARNNGYSNPPRLNTTNGSIVITHDAHVADMVPAMSTMPTPPMGTARVAFPGPNPVVGAPLPWFGAHFKGAPKVTGAKVYDPVDVVALSPAWYDGGVYPTYPLP